MAARRKARQERYDDAVKAMCAARPDAICRLLGIEVTDPVRVDRHAESLPATTTSVDALLLVGDTTAVHVEFQAGGEPWFAYRMLEYLARLVRLPELEGRTIDQHVVLLGDGRLDHTATQPRLRYSVGLHELRLMPLAAFVGDPWLAPFAPLADVGDLDRAAVLRHAFELIKSVPDGDHELTLARATAVLARLRLDAGTITQTWKDAAMPIPSIFDEYYEQGLEQGLERGREQGLEQGLEHMTVTVLRARFGDELPERDAARIARRLLESGPEQALARIEAATSLDDLI